MKHACSLPRASALADLRLILRLTIRFRSWGNFSPRAQAALLSSFRGLQTRALTMAIARSTLFRFIFSVCALQGLAACSSNDEHGDCRPNSASTKPADAQLTLALQDRGFSLVSYRFESGVDTPAVEGMDQRGAGISFAKDGTFSAHSAVNSLSGSGVLVKAAEIGRYFVEDGKLRFCGQVHSSQLAGLTPELQQQERAFFGVLLADPTLNLQGSSLVLTSGANSVTMVSNTQTP